MSRDFFAKLKANLGTAPTKAAEVEQLRARIAEVKAREAVRAPDVERYTCPCGAWKVKCATCGEWWCRSPGHAHHVCRAAEFSQVSP